VSTAARPAPPGLLAHVLRGTGEPVVLLNGGLMSMSAWDPVAVPLATTHRVLRCDFRGQLLSPGAPPATILGHADDLRRLLDHLGLPRVHLAGTSFGALVGLTLAALHPERVHSLAAFTATDRVPPEDWRLAESLREACRAAAEGGDGGRVLDLLAPQIFSAAWLEAQKESLAGRRAQIAALPAGWFRGLAGILGALEGLDLRPLLGRVRCPVLVVAAELDRTFPKERSLALASALPDAKLEVVAGAGHALVLEEPGRVLELMRSFLVRGEREGAQA
jgi:pimeloyl-ACP methyl ester carboxylesterase